MQTIPIEKKIQVLKKIFKNDINSFACYFFGGHHKKETPQFHKDIYNMYMNSNRVVVGAPRGSAKTTITDLDYLAWVIVHNKKKFALLISDSYSQATMFLETLKAEIESNEKLKLFYGDLGSVKWAEGEIVANNTMVKALGAGMKVRGLKFHNSRPDLIILDDLENDELVENKQRREKLERWFNGAVVPSLALGGQIIVIGTILHYDSLLAKLLSKDNYKEFLKKKYAIIMDGKPLWREHLDMDAIENIKQGYAEKGLMSLFYSEYMNDPIDKESQEFKKDFFQYRTWEELNALQTRVYLTIDTAISKKASADYTGFCLNFVDKENKWTIKAWHDRIGSKELIDKLFEFNSQFSIDTIGIEETIYLQAIRPFFEDECRLRNRYPHVVPVKHNQQAKEVRIRGLVPRYESKSIFHLVGGCQDLEDELLTFPKGVHDDIIDALSYQVQIAENGTVDDDLEPLLNYKY